MSSWRTKHTGLCPPLWIDRRQFSTETMSHGCLLECSQSEDHGEMHWWIKGYLPNKIELFKPYVLVSRQQTAVQRLLEGKSTKWFIDKGFQTRNELTRVFLVVNRWNKYLCELEFPVRCQSKAASNCIRSRKKKNNLWQRTVMLSSS